jgi:hypothetical protein
MKTKARIIRSCVALAFFSAGLLMSGNMGKVLNGGSFVAEADAAKVIVKRRHHHHHHHPVRRVVRSAVYISTLPRNCTKVYVNGAGIWLCSGRYYQPYNGRYVLVYVN